MRTLKNIKQKILSKNTLEFVLMLLVGGAMFYIIAFITTPWGPFSRYPAGILRMFVGISFLMYMKNMHMGGHTIKKAIEEKNMAFAVIFLSFAIVIALILASV